MSVKFWKEEELNFDEPLGVIESTNPAKNMFVNDNFTKKIFLYSNWDAYINKTPYKEIDFTMEDVKILREEMPVIPEELEEEFEFEQETNFGEITTKR